jgi:hypothetical protein
VGRATLRLNRRPADRPPSYRTNSLRLPAFAQSARGEAARVTLVARNTDANGVSSDCLPDVSIHRVLLTSTFHYLIVVEST